MRDAEAVARRGRAGRPGGDLPPRRADRRAQVGGRPGQRLARERGGHDQRAQRRAGARRAARGQHLDRRRHLRRGPDHPGARGAPGRARVPLRPVEVLRRELLRAVHPPARAVDDLAALRQRLRPAPGPARRGRRDRDLLRQAARGRPAEDLRRRQADARLRLRRRRGRRQPARSRLRRHRRVQRRPRRPDERARHRRGARGAVETTASRPTTRRPAPARCSTSRSTRRARGPSWAGRPQVDLEQGLARTLDSLR